MEWSPTILHPFPHSGQFAHTRMVIRYSTRRVGPPSLGHGTDVPTLIRSAGFLLDGDEEFSQGTISKYFLMLDDTPALNSKAIHVGSNWQVGLLNSLKGVLAW